MASFPNLVLYPMLFHCLLVFLLLIKLGHEKTKAVKAKQVDRQKAALDNSAWPESVVKISNSLANQFQLPVIFYALSLVVYVKNPHSVVAFVLLCLFVVSRYIHAYIHTTTNYVPHRFRVFTFGALMLLALLVMLFVSLAS